MSNVIYLTAAVVTILIGLTAFSAWLSGRPAIRRLAVAAKAHFEARRVIRVMHMAAFQKALEAAVKEEMAKLNERLDKTDNSLGIYEATMGTLEKQLNDQIVQINKYLRMLDDWHTEHDQELDAQREAIFDIARLLVAWNADLHVLRTTVQRMRAPTVREKLIVEQLDRMVKGADLNEKRGDPASLDPSELPF